jgi:hypothetical protein
MFVFCTAMATPLTDRASCPVNVILSVITAFAALPVQQKNKLIIKNASHYWPAYETITH